MIKPKSICHGGKPKPKPTLGKPNPNPQQVSLHEKDGFTPEETTDNHTQTMVHECLAACDTDPSAIKMSCQFLMSKMALHHQNPHHLIPQDNFGSWHYTFLT